MKVVRDCFCGVYRPNRGHRQVVPNHDGEMGVWTGSRGALSSCANVPSGDSSSTRSRSTH
jgi:hypothetical protein